MALITELFQKDPAKNTERSFCAIEREDGVNWSVIGLDYAFAFKMTRWMICSP